MFITDSSAVKKVAQVQH